jgi:hypothetical protein
MTDIVEALAEYLGICCQEIEYVWKNVLSHKGNKYQILSFDEMREKEHEFLNSLWELELTRIPSDLHYLIRGQYDRWEKTQFGNGFVFELPKVGGWYILKID